MPEERTPAEKVFDQLSSAPIQHPASARLFADWRLQAGDVVKVTSGNETYQVPVYNMEMTWKGSPIVEVDATGSKERPPLPALARRSYGGSQRQAETDEALVGYSSRLDRTDREIIGVVSATGIVLDENGDPVEDEYGYYVFDEGSKNNIYSQIQQVPGQITLAVTAERQRAEGAEQTLTGLINVEAGKISQIVTAVGSDGQVTAASIITAINGDTSSIKLKADHVELVGSTIKISDVISIQNGASFVNASGVSATFMDADTLQLRSGGSGSSFNTVNPNSVSDVQIVANGTTGYKLQKKTWGSPNSWTDAGTFSSAATIAGTWGSGVFTVSATSGTANTVTTSLSNTGHWGSASNEGEVLTTYYYETKATVGTSGTLLDTGNKTQISAASKLTTASGTPSFVQTVDVQPTGTYFGLTKVTINKATISATREANKPTGTELVQTFAQNGYYKAGTDGCIRVNVPEPVVTLADPTWEYSGSSITYYNKYTVTASNGAYKDQMLYLIRSGLTVSLRSGGEGGTERAKTTCTDSNLVAANIKSGVSIFGVTGTYSGPTVTVGDPVWGTSTTSESNTFTVTASNGESTSQTLYLTGSAGSRTVYLKKGSTTGTQLARYIVTDDDLVAGNIKSGVNIFGVTGTYVPDPITLNDPTWNSVASLTTRRTYTVSATNGDSKSQTVLLYNNGNWSSGKTTVYMYKNSTSSTDNRIAALEISIPNSGTWSSNRTGQSNLHVTFKICGKTYETDFGV